MAPPTTDLDLPDAFTPDQAAAVRAPTEPDMVSPLRRRPPPPADVALDPGPDLRGTALERWNEPAPGEPAAASPEYSSIELMPASGDDSQPMELLEDLDADPGVGWLEAPERSSSEPDGDVLDLGDFEVE